MMLRSLGVSFFAGVTVLAWSPSGSATLTSRDLQDPSQISTTVSTETGKKIHIAVPDLLPKSPEPEVASAAKLIAQVLADDITFEAEFDAIPQTSMRMIPIADSLETLPYDAWHDLGADLVVFGTVSKSGADLAVAFHVMSVSNKKDLLGKEYTLGYANATKNPRVFAHRMSDEIHKVLAALDGVAQTRIAFSSDRDGERLGGTIQDRAVKHIYISDYDGANPQRVTASRALNIAPSWAPDGRSLTYTTYVGGGSEVVIQKVYELGDLLYPAGEASTNQSSLSAFSPDGTKIAFMSTRGHPGLEDIYVVNVDGSHPPVRITNSPGGSNEGPAWSPSGKQIAFTSDRGGSKQIFVIGVDGTGEQRLTYEVNCDRPTFSPDGRKIAYAAQNGPAYDIHLLNLGTKEIIALTNGDAMSESPNFSPNGRHVIFTTTRWGKQQLATVGIDGKNVRRVTTQGNNTYPNWGPQIRR